VKVVCINLIRLSTSHIRNTSCSPQLPLLFVFYSLLTPPIQSRRELFVALLLIGQIICQNTKTPTPYADVVYIVDETVLPRNGILNFFTSFVPRLEQTLSTAGLGQQGTGSNNYGLVLFGSNDHAVPYSVQFNNGLLVDYSQFVAEALTHIPTTTSQGNNIDGWAAMDAALNYPLRPNAMHKFILITPNYRQVITTGITRNSLITRLLQKQILLDVIVNASYVQNNETINNMRSKTLGIIHYNRQRMSVTENGLDTNKNFTIGGRFLGPMSAFTTVDDYVFFVQEFAKQCLPNANLPILGSSWDFKFIARGGKDLQYLINGLLNTITLQVNPSLLPTLPIQLPVTSQVNQSSQSQGSQGSQISHSQSSHGSQTSGQCPFSQYSPMSFNNSLFFMIGGRYNFNQATITCIEQHAQLAIIQTIQEASALQILNAPAWVGSYIGNSNPGSTNFVAIHSGQMITVQSTDTFSALCYVTPAPSGCIQPRA